MSPHPNQERENAIMEHHEPYWGEIHTHTALSDGNGSAPDNFEIARSHLDFWAMADHAFDEQVFSLDYRTFSPDRSLLNEEWDEIQELCRTYEDPGIFIPFLAYEWTNFQYGHHNVYYLEYDEPIRMPPTLLALYGSLREVQAFVIPHHGAYPVGICGKDWSCHDERLTPFVEIYSLHGSSEAPGGIEPLLTAGSWMGPGGSGGSVQEGLDRGYRLGIMASSDSHGDHPGAYDTGLIAAYAPELTRQSLWETFRQKRIYGVTGDRITLDFRLNGRPMGSSADSQGAREMEILVVAWDTVERVDIVKNGALLHSFVEPVGASPSPTGQTRFRFMVEWGWDRQDQRDWEGRLRVEGGSILQAVPCYRGNAASRLGRGIAHLSATECRWTSTTPRVDIGRCFRSFADALAVEAECDPAARLHFAFTCAGLTREWSVSPAQVLRESGVTYMEQIPATNDGSHWHHMESVAKVKIHQGWPAERLTLNLSFTDHAGREPGGSTDYYYVRVLQANGQRAWSSPVWVTG
ncbi:MAG: hypothetical protein PVH68_16865 [Armatimonadota bacterium]|jgi:hypothetical protein